MAKHYASELHIFAAPMHGDEVEFADGSRAVVDQGMRDGWRLIDGGRVICAAGFDMQAFLREILAENLVRGAA